MTSFYEDMEHQISDAPINRKLVKHHSACMPGRMLDLNNYFGKPYINNKKFPIQTFIDINLYIDNCFFGFSDVQHDTLDTFIKCDFYEKHLYQLRLNDCKQFLKTFYWAIIGQYCFDYDFEKDCIVLIWYFNPMPRDIIFVGDKTEIKYKQNHGEVMYVYPF